jgi:hypothetical protein
LYTLNSDGSAAWGAPFAEDGAHGVSDIEIYFELDLCIEGQSRWGEIYRMRR